MLVVAAVLRLIMLDLKPPHHDEGVNGFFMTKLLRDGEYRYNAENYHGPTLYYLALPFAKIFGLDNAPLRLEPVLFGVLTVALLLALWPVLGRVGALAAAALMAVSAGAVFVSRYFIHESMVVCFTLGIVVALVWLPRLGLWVSGLLAAASAAMLFCTKETANFTAAVLLIAEYISHFYRDMRASGGSRGGRRTLPLDQPLDSEQVPEIQPTRVSVAFAAAAIVVFAAIFVSFYSSFYTNWHGVVDGIVAPNVWRKTGTHGQGHAQPLGTYLWWLLREEPAILFWGAAGIVLALRRAEAHFTVFTALWGMGMLAAYSIIPYKTPWLTLNIVTPFCICAGYAFEQARASMSKGALTALAVGSLLVGLGLCINLNFFRYDNPNEPYVYVHTTREYNGLMAAIQQGGRGTATSIDIVSPDYWPMPWTLRDYPRAIFHGKMGGDGKADFIVAAPDQAAEIQKRYGSGYKKVGTWTLRPGIPLLLYERVHPDGKR